MKIFLFLPFVFFFYTSIGQAKNGKVPLLPVFTTYYPGGEWLLSAPQTDHLNTYVLSRLREIKDSNFIVRIEGHSDRMGNDSANLELSKKRANTVAGFLIQQGVLKERIQILYYGERKPGKRNSNILKNQRAINDANRRVVITIESI